MGDRYLQIQCLFWVDVYLCISSWMMPSLCIRRRRQRTTECWTTQTTGCRGSWQSFAPATPSWPLNWSSATRGVVKWQSGLVTDQKCLDSLCCGLFNLEITCLLVCPSFVLCVSDNIRYEMLQETVTAYRREISAIQDRNQKMAATAQRHEHIIHTMSQDLRQANEKLALEEVRKKRSSGWISR